MSQPHATPTCIVDHWVLHMFESNNYRSRVAAGEENAEKPTNMIREFTNEEIGETLFTFLFASQDASSSATTWLFQILAQRPDVLQRLREENLSFDPDRWITGDAEKQTRNCAYFPRALLYPLPLPFSGYGLVVLLGMLADDG
ncbi:hypothetical protein SLS60_004432 [Paraconiothyrium brasiliense]|uniref:Cytochrome P450 n=1 Tax=Paraconiothyrium brasiliense TaxID=300254 RepID=A0ABR3RKH1_9PLEO